MDITKERLIELCNLFNEVESYDLDEMYRKTKDPDGFLKAVKEYIELHPFDPDIKKIAFEDFDEFRHYYNEEIEICDAINFTIPIIKDWLANDNPTRLRANENILRYFTDEYVSDETEKLKKLFNELARYIFHEAPNEDSREQAVALRKLLEAKDAAFRCAID